MELNEIISSVGFGVGFIQMYDQLNEERKKVEDRTMIYLALFASLLWLVFNIRKYGLNEFTTFYAVAGFMVQAYVVKTILDQD